MQISAVAFDLDGLMFNTEDLYDLVIGRFLSQRGRSFTHRLKLDIIGLPGLRAATEICQRCGLNETPTQLLHAIEYEMLEQLATNLKPMPGLFRLLDVIEEQGLPKAVATSSSRNFARRALELSGLDKRFSPIFASEDVRNGKPHPEIYLKVAEQLAVSPCNLLVLEDSRHGTLASTAAGAITVAVPGHHSVVQEFGHADFVFASLEEPNLIKLVRGQHPCTSS